MLPVIKIGDLYVDWRKQWIRSRDRIAESVLSLPWGLGGLAVGFFWSIIVDLDGEPDIGAAHLAEAIWYWNTNIFKD